MMTKQTPLIAMAAVAGSLVALLAWRRLSAQREVEPKIQPKRAVRRATLHPVPDAFKETASVPPKLAPAPSVSLSAFGETYGQGI